MSNELGIENLEAFSKGMIDVGGVTDDVLQDGSVDANDIPEVFELLNVIPKFAGAKSAWAEAKDLTIEEIISLKSSLSSYAQSKYPDDDDDAIQRKVDKALQFALAGAEFFKEF